MFRAGLYAKIVGLYAKIVGLNSQGIGSKTAFYYWPNAMIREYIAIFVMNRVRHSIVIAIIMGFSIIATGVNYLFFLRVLYNLYFGSYLR